jgi:RNA polymerase sigma-70 factor (ECF subfamily)
MKSGRANDEWVRVLTQAGPAGDAAQHELRAFLVRGLRRVLAARGAADLGEDIAHDALLRVRERIGEYRGESAFTTWALAIAIRLAFDELRSKRWKDVSWEEMARGSDAGLTIEVEGGSPERAVAKERLLRQLREVIEHELTDRQRQVLSAELSGVPHAEIAARLGMNRNALYKLGHDARKRVKARLEAAGVAGWDINWVLE